MVSGESFFRHIKKSSNFEPRALKWIIICHKVNSIPFPTFNFTVNEYQSLSILSGIEVSTLMLIYFPRISKRQSREIRFRVIQG